MNQLSCDEVRNAAAELALGVVAGEERARLLHHLDRCPVCRRQVAELMPAADAFLLAVPSVEPPAGFEARALRRVLGRRRRARSWIAAVALVLVASLVAVTAAQIVDRRKDRLASEYVEAAHALDGQTPKAARVTTPNGRDVGQAFAYDGRQSFLFVSIADPAPDTNLVAEVVRRNGARWPVGVLTLRGGRGSLGTAVDGEMEDLTELVLTQGGNVRYRARFS